MTSSNQLINDNPYNEKMEEAKDKKKKLLYALYFAKRSWIHSSPHASKFLHSEGYKW